MKPQYLVLCNSLGNYHYVMEHSRWRTKHVLGCIHFLFRIAHHHQPCGLKHFIILLFLCVRRLAPFSWVLHSESLTAEIKVLVLYGLMWKLD